ncbi:MAG: hypothetical protein ABI700_07120 [Chloroflexota bacterium]
MLPARVIHADWSANPRKRWMAEAVLGADGRYTAQAPKLIRDAGLFMLTAVTAAAGGVLIGFDFPIGLPLNYARKAGIDQFLTALPQFGEDLWADFYHVAAHADEISLYRPFYPAKAGGTQRAHLTTALGLADLRRQCDHKTADRPAAAELFWTMGAQQVGKAAISGWQEILAPALKMNEYVKLAIWPFAGSLEALLKPGWIVACEAYPAEFYGHLGVRFPRKAGKGQKSGKRVQADRIANAPMLLEFAQSRDIQLDAALVETLGDGFGSDAFGEDRFDALVSLFGMLNIVLGYLPAGDPQVPEIAQIEGWILGMANENF